ncbi:MAG: hypothetical protein [Olavius algarvensis Delta 4 endosymbiont]|nr:MAG: hypothetical protein [Olavius algarvensis Delta 4 endosymbiont]
MKNCCHLNAIEGHTPEFPDPRPALALPGPLICGYGPTVQFVLKYFGIFYIREGV